MAKKILERDEPMACEHCGGTGISLRYRAWELGNRRQDNWIKQSQIAAHLGVRASTISMWESGRNTIPLEMLKRYEQALNEILAKEVRVI